MLNCRINAFWVQKRGNLESEYEDAFAQDPPGSVIQAESCRLAIADGASESSFANIWAKQITRSYCFDPFKDNTQIKERLNRLGDRWHQIVFRKPLAWYAEEKALKGAFSTLLGVEIFTQNDLPPDSGAWQAIAIGDSCLFQIHENDLHIAWPVVHSKCFGNSPALIGSSPLFNLTAWDQIRFQSGEWHQDDLMFMATDALAAWFLREVEENRKPWNELADFLETPNPLGSFRNWVADRQESRVMRNDDISFLIVEFR